MKAHMYILIHYVAMDKHLMNLLVILEKNETSPICSRGLAIKNAHRNLIVCQNCPYSDFKFTKGLIIPSLPTYAMLIFNFQQI